MKKNQFIILLFALLVITLACNTVTGGLSSNNNSQNSNAPGEVSSDPESNETLDLDCVRLGYACSYEDADPDAVRLSDQLLGEAVELTSEGDLTPAVRFLEAQDEVMAVFHDEWAIFFWVENAVPMVIYHPDFGPDFSNTTSAQPYGKLAAPAPSRIALDDGPIGPQDEGKKATKRALLISPFLWDFGDDEVNETATLLAGHRDYQCADCIDTRITAENPMNNTTGLFAVGPSVENFLGWQRYDLILVSTHGRQMCEDDTPGARCLTLLNTGGFRNEEALPEDPRRSSIYPGVFYGTKASLPDGWRFEVVTSDFFRTIYPSGLSDTMIVLSACQTMISFDLADALIGENTSLVGWDESVDSGPAANINLKFLEYYVTNGLRARVSFDKTLSFDGYPSGGGLADADANLIFRGDDDTRGREVVTIINPETQEAVKANDILLSDGTAGDGQDDDLLIQFRVDGLDEEQNIEEFKIHLKINGEELDQTLSAVDKVGDFSYMTKFELVELPYDVVNDGEKIELEAWIDLPTGGQTRHLVEKAEPVGCGWNATLGAGSYLGGVVFNSYDPGLQDEDALAVFQQYSNEFFDTSLFTQENQVFLMASDENNGLPAFIISSLGGSALFSAQEVYASESPQYSVTPNGDALFGKFGGSFQGVQLGAGITTASVDGEFYWHPKSICGFETVAWLIDAGYSEENSP